MGKIKKVEFNNRMKSFEIITSNGKELSFPYARCELVPTAKNKIVDVYPDPDLGKQGFEYILENGKVNSVLLDSVLDYMGDPEFVKKARLYNMTSKALDLLKANKTPKNQIARRMGATKAHLNRLLDPTFYGKTTDEMIRLLRALDCVVEISYKKASGF